MPGRHAAERWIQAALSLGIGACLALQTHGIYREWGHRADYLYWDPAAHAWYGVRISVALRQLDLQGLLSALNEQVLWPPLHSLLQIPFQLAFGPGFRAASLCSFAFLALTFPALTFLHQQGAPQRAVGFPPASGYRRHPAGLARRCAVDWAGWLVLMAFAASSPYYAGFGSTPMLEIFGAAFTAFAAALYLRASRWFPASLTLLFFLKYNYCLYLLLPILLLRAVEWAQAHRIRDVRRKPTAYLWFLALYLASLAVIFVTGGFRIGKLSVRGIGNPLYVLLLIVVVRAAIRGEIAAGWRRIRGSGWEWFAVPVLLWLIIPVPNRVRMLVSFAVNVPLGGHTPSEMSYYTFHFRALSVYFSSWWLEALCLAGAVGCVVLFWRRRDVRVAALLFALPFLLMTLNQNKQERFLFTFVFALWILCGWAVSRIPVAAVRLAAAAFSCVACALHYDLHAAREQVAWPFVPPAVEAPVAFLAEQAARAEDVRILGTVNEMSPGLLAFHISRASGVAGGPRLGFDLKGNAPAGTLVCGINLDAPGCLVVSRQFPGYRIECSTAGPPALEP